MTAGTQAGALDGHPDVRAAGISSGMNSTGDLGLDRQPIVAPALDTFPDGKPDCDERNNQRHSCLDLNQSSGCGFARLGRIW